MTTADTTPMVGYARSSDVDLFYRRFGSGGALPVLILHGANYYDSEDWVQIAAGLAGDREVCTFDARGYGQSGWSPAQDYSLDAHLGDIETLLGHLGWERALLLGHSRGGSIALRFANTRPERVGGLVLVDFSPGQTPRGAGSQPARVGPRGPVYESLEQAHGATSRNPGELGSASGRKRAGRIFGRADGGWVNVQRDPAFQSDRPNDRPDWRSALPSLDLWQALTGLVALGRPALVVHATRSTSYDEAALARLRAELPTVKLTEIDSGHDVPGTAPLELVSAVQDFLSNHAG